MMKTLRKMAILAAVAGLSMGLTSQAWAESTSCSDILTYDTSNSNTDELYGPGSFYGGYLDTYDSCYYNNTANKNAVSVTSNAVLRAAVGQTSRLISGRVAAAMAGNTGFDVADNGFSASSGIAAGGMEDKLAVWVSGAYSNIEDNNTATAFDGNVYNVMGGVDYKMAKKTLIGLAVGYENVDVDTQYNGFNGQDGSFEGDGYTIAPYVGVQLAPNASFDLTVGYSNLDYDTLRYDPISGNRITGSTDADRYFVNAAVSGKHSFANKWNLYGRGAVFYADEEKDGFTETESNGNTISQSSQDNELGQFLVDAKLGYAFDYVEPYVLAGVEYDFAKDEAVVGSTTPNAPQSQSSLDDEDFAARFGAGLNLRLAPNVTGGIEAYTVEFREDYNETTVSGGLRVKF